jgi:hypothetical protein
MQAQLAPGRAVASWELLAALPAPLEGAGLLLVPEPAIAFAAAAGNLLTSPTS